jgi:hypothetical protein
MRTIEAECSVSCRVEPALRVRAEEIKQAEVCHLSFAIVPETRLWPSWQASMFRTFFSETGRVAAVALVQPVTVCAHVSKQ